MITTPRKRFMKDEKGNDANLVQKDGEALASTSREEVMNDNCSEIDQKCQKEEVNAESAVPTSTSLAVTTASTSSATHATTSNTFTAIVSPIMNETKTNDQKEMTWSPTYKDTAGPSVESTNNTAPKNADISLPSSETNKTLKTDNEIAEAIEISTAAEQPSTSFVKPADPPPPDERADEEDGDDGVWMVGNRIAHTTRNAHFIEVISRRCGQMCARTDLVYRMRSGSEWDRKKEARSAMKNHINNVTNNVNSNIQKKPAESVSTSMSLPKATAAQLTPLSGAANVEAFMGGRVPMNGTAVSGIPGMFPGIPDPRIPYLTPQHQYALAIEQQAFQKQLEQQLRAQVHQMELMRNGGTNGTVTNSAVRDSPSRGGPGAAHGLPPNMMPPPYHNFNMDPRALASLMHNTHMAQFGMSPMDGHAAAMMNAFEQRNALEQRMLASMAGMEMLAAQGGLPVSQAPAPTHIHPHAAAMMQHAAVAAAAQPNGEALQLQQLLAMSAAQSQRPFLEQNPLLQISMMNPFGNDLASRMINPGALNSDMMRRLQQEGGFTAAQRP